MKRHASPFEVALAAFPSGFSTGLFQGDRWSVTVKRSDDGKRIWLFAEDLRGDAIVSFNAYELSGGLTLKPCEMSSEKVMEFVLRFVPSPEMPAGEHRSPG